MGSRRPFRYLKMTEGGTWFFTRRVPGQTKRMVVSLKTTDSREAQRRRDYLLANMKLQQLSPEQEAVQLGKEYRTLSGERDRYDAEIAYEEWAEALEPKLGEEEAVRLYRLATSKIVPVLSYEEAYNAERPVEESSQKTRTGALSRLPYKYVHDYTPKSVGELISDLVANSGLATSTIRQRVTHWKSYFLFLLTKGVISSSPFTGQRIVGKKTKSGSQPWSFNECKIMLSETEGDTRLLLEIMLYTGVRIGEASLLKCGDIGYNFFKIQDRAKTEAGLRTCWVPMRIANALHFRCEKAKKGDYILFPEISDKTEDQRTTKITAEVNLLLAGMFPETKVAGRRNRLRTAHGLRKTFSSCAENSGIPISTIQTMVGQSRGTVLLDVYSKPSDKVLKEAFAKAHAALDDELI